jgi:hypothetical protein
MFLTTEAARAKTRPIEGEAPHAPVTISMPKLELHIDIAAPQKLCFDLARDAAFHIESVHETGERIVNGKSSGFFELGDEVVFEGRHLGVRQRLGARITAMEAPIFFIDEMTRGVFQSLSHRHDFIVQPDGCTRMIDTLEWRSPLGILGLLADALVGTRHMRHFLQLRGERIKLRAESQAQTSTT